MENYEVMYGQYYPWHLELLGKSSTSKRVEDVNPVKIDYRNKVVLDVGADWGSTADFFLKNGASKVIAVESDTEMYDKLLRFSNEEKRITALRIYIADGKQITDLITEYKPSIVKIDCENCEKHLTNVPWQVLRIPRMYLIEYHDVYDTSLKQYLIRNGFHIAGCLRWANTTDKQVFEKTYIEVIVCERMG